MGDTNKTIISTDIFNCSIASVDIIPGFRKPTILLKTQLVNYAETTTVNRKVLILGALLVDEFGVVDCYQ